MHTTLRLLKQTEACIPGYSRMIGFFGTSQSLKDVPIPFHAIALIGEPSDVDWAVTNAAIIDPVQYDAFYRYHLASVLNSLFWHCVDEGSTKWNEELPLTQDLRRDIMKVSDYESAKTWLNKANTAYHDHWIWKNVIRNPVFSSRGAFIEYVVNAHDHELYDDHIWALMHQDTIAPPEIDYKDRKRIKEFALTIPNRCYFQDAKVKRPSNVNLAHVLNCGKDPYQSMVEFMAAHSITNRNKGIMLSQANDGQPPGFHMTINLSDPELIFRMYHVMNANNFDVNSIIGVDKAASSLRRELIESGIHDDVTSYNIETVYRTSDGRLVLTESASEAVTEDEDDGHLG